MKYINLCPHEIVLNDGRRFPSEGIARVNATFRHIDGELYSQEFGDIVGLPEAVDGTMYIVSLIVLDAAKGIGRTDCVAPATGHPDCVRKDGFIVSVPGFVM